MLVKARLPLRPVLTRAYASRLPQRPCPKVQDPLLNNPHAAYQDLPGDLTFIHRPPPSAASPESFTTAPSSPLISDALASAGADAASTLIAPRLPPRLKEPKPAPPRMSREDIEKMRALRKEDPEKWTAGKLAKEFDCTQMFVQYMAPLSNTERKEALVKRDAEHARYRARWGEKKQLNNEIRRKRKDYW